MSPITAPAFNARTLSLTLANLTAIIVLAELAQKILNDEPEPLDRYTLNGLANAIHGLARDSNHCFELIREQVEEANRG